MDDDEHGEAATRELRGASHQMERRRGVLPRRELVEREDRRQREEPNREEEPAILALAQVAHARCVVSDLGSATSGAEGLKHFREA